MQKKEHVMSEHNRLPKEWLLRGLFHLSCCWVTNYPKTRGSQPKSLCLIIMAWIWTDLKKKLSSLLQFLLENFSLKMRCLNMSQDNWGTWGDLPVAYGAAGGHSVVRGQVMGLENPSWLIPTSGAHAGMSGRLDSVGLSTRAPAGGLASMLVTGRETSYAASWASKRKSHMCILLSWLGSHRPSQIQGGEYRGHLFVEGGSKNLRPCFKTAEDGSHWRPEAHVQSMELAHSMYFRS